MIDFDHVAAGLKFIGIDDPEIPPQLREVLSTYNDLCVEMSDLDMVPATYGAPEQQGDPPVHPVGFHEIEKRVLRQFELLCAAHSARSAQDPVVQLIRSTGLVYQPWGKPIRQIDHQGIKEPAVISVDMAIRSEVDVEVLVNRRILLEEPLHFFCEAYTIISKFALMRDLFRDSKSTDRDYMDRAINAFEALEDFAPRLHSAMLRHGPPQEFGLPTDYLDRLSKTASGARAEIEKIEMMIKAFDDMGQVGDPNRLRGSGDGFGFEITFG